MAVVPFLATRAQRAFIATGKSSLLRSLYIGSLIDLLVTIRQY